MIRRSSPQTMQLLQIVAMTCPRADSGSWHQLQTSYHLPVHWTGDGGLFWEMRSRLYPNWSIALVGAENFPLFLGQHKTSWSGDAHLDRRHEYKCGMEWKWPSGNERLLIQGFVKRICSSVPKWILLLLQQQGQQASHLWHWKWKVSPEGTERSKMILIVVHRIQLEWQSKLMLTSALLKSEDRKKPSQHRQCSRNLELHLDDLIRSCERRESAIWRGKNSWLLLRLLERCAVTFILTSYAHRCNDPTYTLVLAFWIFIYILDNYYYYP